MPLYASTASDQQFNAQARVVSNTRVYTKFDNVVAFVLKCLSSAPSNYTLAYTKLTHLMQAH